MSLASPMLRVIEPELLDVLPADDARAIKSRRDLALINRIMLQAALMAGLLAPVASAGPIRLLEIGSGDGGFMLDVARRLAPRARDVRLLLLDRQNIVDDARLDAFAALGWRAERVSADVFDYLRSSHERFDAVSANLFLHHFDAAALADMLTLAAERAGFFAACEPRRDAVSLLGSRLVGVLGCNDVTRHDAVASVRAGFSGRDLSELWPKDAGWRLSERRAGFFTHAFTARKDTGPRA